LRLLYEDKDIYRRAAQASARSAQGGVTSYAFTECSDYLDRSGFSALAGEPANSHATNYEVNIECSSSRVRGFLAIERFWNYSFSFRGSGWSLNP
jgi:hypothetical protein